MNGKRALFAALAVLFFAQIFYYYSFLPEKIASHFNAAGEPDDFMSKPAFLIFEFVLFGFVIGLFSLISFSLRKLPFSLINLPNKDYWLAPERRAATFRTLENELQTFQIALLTLFVSINQLVFRANIKGENLSPASWLIVAAFVVFTLVWTFNLNRKFKKINL